MNRLKFERVGFWLVFITILTLLYINWELQVQRNNEFDSLTSQYYKHLDNPDSVNYYRTLTLQFREENNLDSNDGITSYQPILEVSRKELSELIFETKKESRTKKMNINRLTFGLMIIGFICLGFLRKNWSKRSKV